MDNNGIRINKYLSDSGICSRREADRQIEEGNVTIDGRIATMGDRVLPGQKVLYKGIPAEIEEERILIAFNKPVGIVCTAEKREKDNVIDYINYPKRIYPVGRLDKDSEGLLLLTNQGEIVNKMMRSGNMHEKEYIVTLWQPVTDSLIRGLAGGVPLVDLGVTTRPCTVEKLGHNKFRIILTQGYNRQIRRMCEYFGFRVKELKRVRVMNIELGDLAPGKYREVTENEYRVLMRLIRDSSNTTVTEAPKKQFKTEKVQARFDRYEEERRSGSRRPYEKKDGERRPYEKKDSERRPFEKRDGKPAGKPNTAPVKPAPEKAAETPEAPKKKQVFVSNASHSQSSAFEERQRQKALRQQAKLSRGEEKPLGE